MAAQIPACGICHRETRHMFLTVVKHESTTHLCSEVCYRVFSALRESIDKLAKEMKSQKQDIQLNRNMIHSPTVNDFFAKPPEKDKT